MEIKDVKSRLEKILPKGQEISRGHLAELLWADPVLRLAPAEDMIDKLLAEGIIEGRHLDKKGIPAALALTEERQE